jgi:hypothetical protein
MIKLIVASLLALALIGCASNSLPEGFYMSPFIVIDEAPKPSNPAPVSESDES